MVKTLLAALGFSILILINGCERLGEKKLAETEENGLIVELREEIGSGPHHKYSLVIRKRTTGQVLHYLEVTGWGKAEIDGVTYRLR